VLLVFLHLPNWASCAASLTALLNPWPNSGLRPGLVGLKDWCAEFFRLLLTFLSAVEDAGSRDGGM
jgi:hypothetical protein